MQGVRDLDLLAGSIGASMRAGGDLLVYDAHPAALCVDGLMHWREDYFEAGFHRLGQLVGALARHDLAVRALEEYPPGTASFHDQRLPETFLLHARKIRVGRAVAADDAAERVGRDVAGDPRVLLEPAQRVLVPLAAERHVDPQALAALHELVAERLPHAEQHLELVVRSTRREPLRLGDEELVVRRDADERRALEQRLERADVVERGSLRSP